MNKQNKRLSLIAIANKWHIEEAEEELGDALYRVDPALYIERDPKYPLLYVFTNIPPVRAFYLAINEPPAYIERLVPVQELFKYKIIVKDKNSILFSTDFLDILSRQFRIKCEGKCMVECRPRNMYILVAKTFDKRTARKYLEKKLASILGTKLDRKAEMSLIIEDTRYGIVAALMRRGYDRVRTWREKRLQY
ncbi:hypothetical protein PYJP_03730 [Pyrofollis japonicus]|uniref:hypothetical protein n=1 Tax=Pyrofollis japonicus TaxID=3060460 RepID=UPI00295A7CFE|nr:hypothetical protein [Pyrofollis japonicus]BEP17021.1 hypothetical protein PYJP_03730 [Pyrofollis japonicus]